MIAEHNQSSACQSGKMAVGVMILHDFSGIFKNSTFRRGRNHINFPFPESWVRKINEIPSISFRPSLEQEEIRPSAHSERERKILVNFVSRGEYFRFVGAELCTVKINH
jgi:hypothetical protein